MSKTREEQVAERRSFIPKCFQGTYDKAVQGKSLRAAVTGFCAECVSWATNEVRNCSDKACPLWKVRPYQDVPQSPRKGGDTASESTKSNRRGIG